MNALFFIDETQEKHPHNSHFLKTPPHQNKNGDNWRW
jgi:hypothetical protein